MGNTCACEESDQRNMMEQVMISEVVPEFKIEPLPLPTVREADYRSNSPDPTRKGAIVFRHKPSDFAQFSNNEDTRKRHRPTYNSKSRERASKSVTREESAARQRSQGRIKVHQLRGQWDYPEPWKEGRYGSYDKNASPYSDE